MVLARAVAARRRLCRDSISIPATTRPSDRVLDVARWVRDELASLRVPAVAEDIRLERPAHLRSAAAVDVVRVRHAVLPDRRDGGRVAASEGGDRGAHRARAAARHRLRRFSAEHPRQDARDGLQRARQRASPACRRRSRGRSSTTDRSARLHDRDGAGAIPRGRRSVGAAAYVEACGSRNRVQEISGQAAGRRGDQDRGQAKRARPRTARRRRPG